MRKKAANPKPKKGPAASKSKAPPAAVDPRAAYEELLPRATALADPPVSYLSPALCRRNVTTAMTAIAPYLRDKKKLGAIDGAKVALLPAVAAAFEYAETLVPKTTSEGSIEDALAAVRPIRGAALAYLAAAVYCGLVDAGRVAAIRAGRGRLDVAQDAVAIAGVFADYETVLVGKHPFTRAQLGALASRGAWLTERLTPSGAVRDARTRAPEATTKDAFGALLEDAWAELEKLAVQVWGVSAFREHVPALRAREHAHHGMSILPPSMSGSTS
jgi:hypothetical protein